MSEDDGQDPLTDLFTVPVDGDLDPRPILAHLVATTEQFVHLREGEAVIMVLFRNFEKVKQRRRELGRMALPVAMGAMKELVTWLLANTCGGDLPDFIMTLEWEWWREASPKQREALVFHELLHAGHDVDRDGELKFTEDGRPVFCIIGHDLEEFDEVVRRYGAWKSDIASFSDALREGGRN